MIKKVKKINILKGKVIHLGGRDYRIVYISKNKNLVKAVRVDNNSEIALVRKDVL